jgi:glycosyltransferase involved in cell wall biosynthesis
VKIVHIIPNPLYHGGVETFVGHLCKHIVARGYSVTVCCLNNTLLYQYRVGLKDGVLIKEFKPIVGDPFYIPPHHFVHSLNREDADIIHVHNIHTLLPIFITALKRRPRSILLQPHYHRYGQNIVRNVLLSIHKRVLKTVFLRHFDAIIANSKYEKAIFEKDFPNVSSKIVLIPEEYSIALPPDIKWNPSEGKKSILYVGALRKYKNVDILIKAFKILVSKRSDLDLTIIGNGPEKRKLIKLAQDLGVYDQITWKENLPYDELLQEYARARVLVLLSKLESFSRVAYEAASMGVPLIVYDYGALNEFVQKGFAKGVGSLDYTEVASAVEAIIDVQKPIRKPRQYDGNLYTDLILKVYENSLKG